MKLMLLLLLCLDVAFCLRVTSAEVYTKKNMSIMGDQYSVGVFDLTLDDDISIYRTYGHCPVVSCYSATCTPCDFTDPAICNGTKRPYTGNLSNDCGGCVNASSPPLICRPSSVWPYPSLPPLKGNSLRFKVPRGGVLIPYHPTPPNNCSSMVPKLTALKGGDTGTLMWYAATWTGSNKYNILTRLPYNVVCPYQPPPLCQHCGWGQTVMFIFTPDDNVIESESLLEIEWIPLPYTNQNKYPNTCTLPNGLTDHICIPEAVQQTISPSIAGQVFRFVVTTKATRPTSELCPGLLHVSVSTINVLISTTDPWVSSVNSTNALRAPNFDAFRAIPGVWGICIPPGGSIYIWVYTTDLSSFTIMADTNREWIIEDQKNNQGPHDYYMTLMPSVTVNCGNKSFTPFTRSYSAL